MEETSEAAAVPRPSPSPSLEEEPFSVGRNGSTNQPLLTLTEQGNNVGSVFYQGHRVHIFEASDQQLLLTELDGGHVISVQRIRRVSFGQAVLRGFYTLVMLLFLVFLLAFALQLVLFLAMNAMTEAGVTEQEDQTKLDGVPLLGTFLAAVVFICGLSMCMALSTSLVVDTWRGGPLLRSLTPLPDVVTDLLYVLTGIVIPLFTFIVSCFMQVADPWQVTAKVWMVTIGIVWMVFAVVITAKETIAAVRMVQGEDLFDRFHQCFLYTQTSRYMGIRHERFTVSGDTKTKSKVSMSLYSRLVQICPFGFEKVEDALAQISNRPFVTRSNWSLDSLFCNQDHVTLAASGPSALRADQAAASLACSLFGAVLIVLLTAGALVFFQKGWVLVLVVLVVAVLFCLYPMLKDSLSLLRTYKSLETKEEAQIFSGWEQVCVARPKSSLCYALVALELGFLFLWPLVTLYATNSSSLATVFLFLAQFLFFPVYFDGSAVLAQQGLKEANDSDLEELLLAKINRRQSVLRWAWGFGVFVFFLYAFFLITIDADLNVEPEDRPEIKLVSDFYYQPSPDLAYPNCELTKGFKSGTATKLMDFSFLSAIAYEEPRITKEVLETWFGPNQVFDEADLVSTYRAETKTENIPVWFKLFSFPNFPGFGIVAVRGSQTNWDWMVNVQTWASAASVQVLTYAIPFGWIWRPIMDEIVKVVDFVESSSLKDVAYYRVIAQFCRDLRNGYTGDSNRTAFTDIRLTGVSLGGGMAAIAGAQAGVNTVSLSGPGAVIGRKTFVPEVTLEEIDSHILTVIPDRDIIARLGGRGRLFQEIDCTAERSDLMGCHSMWRTLCELAFTCGTDNRPVLCMCVEHYDYPEPTPLGNRTFAEACGF